MSSDWGRVIGDVVDGWLFDEPGPLPAVMLVPLENPHLHDPTVWRDVVGDPVHTNGVSARHVIDGVPVGLAKPVLGATATAMLVDAVARRGVNVVVGVGFCGGTDPALHCGDLVIATSACCDDGVSTAYDPAARSVGANGELVAMAGETARRGPVLSVAAVHLETQALVDACVRQGILGVDLETAALYTVARLRDLAAVAVLTVSDVPARGAAAEIGALRAGFAQAVRLGAAIAVASRPATSS